MEPGRILNIQRYCLHDGPGIRTTVFLKGCPLTCPWCHNPESQQAEAEVRVLEARCVRCGQCSEACPQRSAEETVDQADIRCTRCGMCVEACPTGARQMLGQLMTVEQVLERVLRDRLFYDDSGGGVTLSGGEPLMQPHFSLGLLRACRGQSVHTALDTCGYASRDTLLALAAEVDLFLYDLKCMDDQLHRAQTGVSNESILENLQALAAIHDNIWIRIPLIPGFNDSPDQLESAARFVATLPGARQVNLLPYHKLGTDKAKWRAASDETSRVASASEEHWRTLAAALRSTGLPVLIGG
jgi:pyruvate formate lyase activating enzyme